MTDGALVADASGGVLTRAVDALDARRPRTGTMRKNSYANIIAVDDRASRMLGYTPEEMLGQRSLNFLHPDDQERAIANWMELLSTRGSTPDPHPAADEGRRVALGGGGAHLPPPR